MKALISKTPGGPDSLSLENIAKPVPGKGEVRIAVKAVGLNFPDLLIIRDLYQFKPPRPFAPGSELSGIVESTGEGVTQLKAGDRVLAFSGWGGLAEQAVVPESRVSRIPDQMSFEDAAAFMMTYGTSYHALKDRAGLGAGKTLLVLGASGGVGLAAVELGKVLGARVLAAASSEEKLQTALDAGADDGLVYPLGEINKKELSTRFKELCGKSGADVIYDPVGGDYSEPALRAIAWEGQFLVVGFPAGIAKLPMNLPLLKACSVTGVFWGAAVERNPSRHAEATAELFDFYAEGKVKPKVEVMQGLENAAAALEKLSRRKVQGKLVVGLG
ncbi:NADPH:quinone oxidoreductase family protein [Ruegeria pomeroyi]|uniref:NADPH:quinone oxidoreductase family protein n=1 Tax=Ruegeria alba TaxID=2916756 RepID=A0ABS9NQY7_9RHOB|nr:NADPH:quinone oxidoreductase family protein [Ruegeria alba]MCE8511170.1 NADPH:quinone oxidoreductase family protein [Ruegeria pomeroyi]MCE8519574.1 NADPH:quinone oxidoreductase family protein [Ruegeria pomeroyi]MCE8524285.1 NADPH:quinone oxidoreductase family protein [Ruegeria pomeroyi]MCE8528189.1 NADPH:quinone oxidoreductase family protein [Ruegeria pomeroyi]MCE8531982.1 NADPH:quinone oxidoreductase family protein [Ruegeria pomeroyi]